MYTVTITECLKKKNSDVQKHCAKPVAVPQGPRRLPEDRATSAGRKLWAES